MIQRKRKKKRLHLNTDKTRTQKKIIDTPIEKHPKATHGLKRSPVTEKTSKEMSAIIAMYDRVGNMLIESLINS